jgi:hypothetical protein
MKLRSKVLLTIAGAGMVGLVIIVTLIDMRQRRPLGAELDAPQIVYSTDKASPFSIADLQWVSQRGVRFLTGSLIDARKEGDETPLPGALLDLQVPGRAERARRLAGQMAAESAMRTETLGHADLAATMLLSSLSRGQPRQVIAHLGEEGRIDIDATIAGDKLSFFVSPSGKTTLFDTGEHESTDPSDDPFLYQAFTSHDHGVRWIFAPEVRAPHSFRFGGLLSDEWVYTMDDGDRLWTRTAPGRPWLKIDLAPQVWADHLATGTDTAHYIGWTLLPGADGTVLGWSTWWDRTFDRNGSLAEQKARTTRRFEVALSSTSVPRVHNASPVEGIEELVGAPHYDFYSTSNGDFLWKGGSSGVRHLSPATGQWSPQIHIPSINGTVSWVDKIWADDEVWIVEAYGRTAWGVASCYIPPYFSSTRGCGDMSAHAYFFSTDQGTTWTPFRLPSTSQDGTPKVLGWDSTRHKLLVTRERYLGPTTIEAYALPPAADS